MCGIVWTCKIDVYASRYLMLCERLNVHVNQNHNNNSNNING